MSYYFESVNNSGGGGHFWQVKWTHKPSDNFDCFSIHDRKWAKVLGREIISKNVPGFWNQNSDLIEQWKLELRWLQSFQHWNNERFSDSSEDLDIVFHDGVVARDQCLVPEPGSGLGELTGFGDRKWSESGQSAKEPRLRKKQSITAASSGEDDSVFETGRTGWNVECRRTIRSSHSTVWSLGNSTIQEEERETES